MFNPELLKQGANPSLHFLPHLDARLLAEALVSFANSSGGTIVVGVNEQGQVLGQIYGEGVEQALQDAEEMCSPPVVVGTWEQVVYERKSLIAIRVPRSIELHALTDGRVMVRGTRDNRPLGGHEIRRLAVEKSTGDFELETVPGATLDDYDRDVVNEFIQKRSERTRRPWTGKFEDLMKEVGACNDKLEPTVAGVMLFAKYPQQWLPQAGVVFVKFVGTEPRGEDGLAGYARREEITGPLARVVENVWNLTWGEMAVSAVVKGLERTETYEYPQFAVREALVNAVAHRDYRLKGRRIEVRMFADRLEVISPGGLPGFITVDNIVEEHFSRNPRMVSGLFQWGYIEELGLGIDKMIDAMVSAGHQAPHFDAKPYSFGVRLYNARQRHVPDMILGDIGRGNVNFRQARALAYVRDRGSITNREYRLLCEEVSPETLRLDLADLVEKGMLLKIGSKKGTYYIIK
jgi:ATP-dependent DNA helicase RecG